MRTPWLIAVFAWASAGCRPPAPTPAPATAAQPSATARVDSVHVALGLPLDDDPSDDIVLDETYFVLSYDAERMVPNWVSWRLTADDLGSFARSDEFHADGLLPPGITPVGKDDYVGSGYDRGHMCPSAQRTASDEANIATFVMTNMQPQLHTLNAGAWKSLETYERNLVADGGKDVYVVAGGLFDEDAARIGPGVSVPKANYRITVVLDHASTSVTTTTLIYAVVMPNSTGVKGHKWTEHLTTVDDVESKTGYDFLAAVPDDVEDVVEAAVGEAP